MPLERADVVVVGGGVIGLSVAYHLSAEGARVVVLERDRIGGGASSANQGTVAMVSKKPGPLLELALESRRRFDGLGAELGHDIEFEVCGVLVVAETEPELDFLHTRVEEQRACGAAVELVDAARARELCPALSQDVLGGSYGAADGQVDPFQLTYGFAAAAERHGARISTATAVDEIEVERGRVVGVRAGSRRIRTEWVVNAAGASADRVASLVGIGHGVRPRRGQAMVVSAPPTIPRVKVMTARQLVAKQQKSASEGRLSFGYAHKPAHGVVILGSTNEDVGHDRRTTDEGLQSIAAYARRLVPDLSGLPVIRTWAGLRPHREGGPLIGPAGGPAGYLAAVGHSGDGIALSPVTGAMISKIVTTSARRSRNAAAVTT